jgi:hypothetical protein
LAETGGSEVAGVGGSEVYSYPIWLDQIMRCIGRVLYILQCTTSSRPQLPKLLANAICLPNVLAPKHSGVHVPMWAKSGPDFALSFHACFAFDFAHEQRYIERDFPVVCSAERRTCKSLPLAAAAVPTGWAREA